VHGDLDVPEDPCLARFLDRAGEDLVLREVLAADVDEDVARFDRVCRDEAALDQAVRHARHHLAVLERARLRLVGVDDEVLRLRALPVDERRLPPHRESGPAAAAQGRLLELVDQRV